MLRVLKLVIAIPAALAIIAFAIANRQMVRVSFDPFSREAPAYALDAPLFAVALAALALGIVAGGIGAWLVQGKHRRAERQLKREVTRLSGEAEALRAVAPQSSLASLPVAARR
jgi:uncharacterized membrane protein YciS (DUF1049 family)